MEGDPNLLLEAAEKKVVIATPATMVALLQVTALGWREAAYAESTQRVRELATQLVERLGVLVRHYNKMGTALDATVRAHNEGAGSIESRLLVTGRELGRLGISHAEELESPQRIERPVRQLPEQDQTGVPGSQARSRRWFEEGSSQEPVRRP